MLKLTTLVRLNVHIFNSRNLARLHVGIVAILILTHEVKPLVQFVVLNAVYVEN